MHIHDIGSLLCVFYYSVVLTVIFGLFFTSKKLTATRIGLAVRGSLTAFTNVRLSCVRSLLKFMVWQSVVLLLQSAVYIVCGVL